MALLNALIEALQTKSFGSVSVKSLCAVAETSEPTFFNHFGSKEEVLVYFVRLWSIDVLERLADECLSGRESIALIFDETARQMAAAPRVMHEIIGSQMRREKPSELPGPTLAELMLRFPKRPSTWDLQPQPAETSTYRI
jgi:AcrR family transcriptional regulator